MDLLVDLAAADYPLLLPGLVARGWQYCRQDTVIVPITLAMLTNSGEVRPLEEMETEIIRFAISHYRGQMSEVARRLKIGRSTLYRKLDEAAANNPSAGNADDAN